MFFVLFLFVFLVLFVSIYRNNLYYFVSMLLFYVTRLSGILVCTLWSFFFFCFCCFVLNLFFFVFFIPLKKDPPKNRTRQKPKNAKMQKKRTKKKSVSAVVFTNSVL